jgi:hypothetical protein
MPIFTLAELVKPVTRQEVQASIYSALGILGINTTGWKPGAPERAIVVGVSVVLAGFSQLMALTTASGFLELAEKEWLTIVAHYVYGVDRVEASFATGYVEVTNTAGGEYDLDPDDLVFQNVVTGRTYRNLEHVTIPPGPATVVSVAVIATEAGSASTSGAGEITQLTTTLLGVTCTNPAAVVGRDAETDPALRSRCSEKLGALSPFGPWDAYASAVRNATRPDGTSLGINRFRMVKDGYGNVITYVATPSGEVPGDANDPSTDLGIANEAIQHDAAPLAVTATIETADALPVPITYEAWIYNTIGRTEAEIIQTINARLAPFMSSQPIAGNRTDPEVPSGGKVYVETIRSTIVSAFPAHIFRVVISAPAGDVDVGPTEVPVLSGAPLATAIHQVPPPEGFNP